MQQHAELTCRGNSQADEPRGRDHDLALQLVIPRRSVGPGMMRPSSFYEAGREGLLYTFRLEAGGVVLLPSLGGVADSQDEDSGFFIHSWDPATIPESRFLRALGGGGKPSLDPHAEKKA